MAMFSIHFLLLTSLGIWRTKIKGWPKSEAFPCIIVLVWANVVLTSLALSIFNQLGNNSLFILVSLPVHGLLLCAISQYTGTTEEPWSELIKSLWESKLGKTLILWASIVCLILFAMAIRTTLQIPDSVAIKLPNAFFYLQKGNLLPAPEFSGDGRMFGVPFNGALLWSYLFRFHQPLQLILLWNLLCWTLIFLGGFKLSRSLGISPMGSLTATSLFCFSQQLLFQASTDNDDLLSSVTGTWAAIYIIRWIRSPNQNWALLAGLALGISTGAKLFPALYWPGLLALALFLLWRFYQKSENRGKLMLQGTVIVLLAALLVFPYFYAGMQTRPDATAIPQVLSQSDNKPFRWEILYRNVVVYNSQLLISPIIDIFSPRATETRKHLVQKLNTLWNEKLIPEVENYWAYVPGTKIFHEALYENTAWFGLFSLLALAGMILMFLRKRSSTWIWLALLFLSWDITFCGRTKYIEELGRYWLLPLSLTIPFVGLLWDYQFESERLRRIRTWAFRYVWLSTIVLAISGLVFNEVRLNFKNVLRSEGRTPGMAAPLKTILRQCPQVNAAQFIYGYPIYMLMEQFRGSEFTYFPKILPNKTNIIPAVNVHLAHQFFANKYVAVPTHPEPKSDFLMIDPGIFGIPHFVSDLAECPAITSLDSKNYLLFQLSSPLDKNKTNLNISITPLASTNFEKYEYRVLIETENSRAETGPWRQGSIENLSVSLLAKKLKIEIKPRGHEPVVSQYGEISVGEVMY